MKSVTHIQLTISEDLSARLARLQAEFARACNYVAPIAKANHCWNRVTLHHLSYRHVREHFPDLGSQMACNAIYSVCRSYRLLLSHPQSPFFGKKIKEGDLPQIAFLPHSPVFFDRHTLSLQKSTLSLFTLEGRLRFGIALSAEDEQRFRSEKLREIQLLGHGGQYRMSLYFDAAEPAQSADGESPWPDYVVLTDLVAGNPHIQADSANAASTNNVANASIASAPLKQAS